MWNESDNRNPMVCFLSMGSDPTENIERLAKIKGIRKFYGSLMSMLLRTVEMTCITMMISSFSSSYHEKATETLCM